MASDPQGWDPQGWDPQGIGYQATQKPYAYLNGVSKYAGRPGDTSNLHPEFADNMARAIQQARAAGLNVGLESAYRTPTQLIGQKNPNASFDAAGNSLHSYGLAADVNGIGPAGSKSAQLWAQIARQNGLYNPYSASGSEYNHWQAVPFTLDGNQDAKTALMKASQSGNFNNVWTAANAYMPGAGGFNAPSTYASNISATTSSPGGKFKVPGTTITSTGDAASNPVDYRQSLYQSLIGKGLNPEQARGVLISMMGESGQGLNPGAFNPKDPGGAMGFAQWVGPRRAGLQSTAKALGTAETDPTAQVAYFNSEISGPYAKVLDQVKQAKDAAEANQIWTTGFERPAKDNSAQRFAGNQNAIVIDKNGAPVFSTNAAAAADAAPAAAGGAAGATGTAAGGAGGTAMGFQTQAGEDAFLKAAKGFQKATGGGGDAQGQGGPPDIQQSPMVGPPSSAQNVSPLLAMVPMTYGQTINSLQDPLTWNSNPPGRPPPAPQPGAGVGRQGPMGTSLNSMAMMDPNMAQFPQSPITGMGYMGMGYGYSGGGMPYG